MELANYLSCILRPLSFHLQPYPKLMLQNETEWYRRFIINHRNTDPFDCERDPVDQILNLYLTSDHGYQIPSKMQNIFLNIRLNTGYPALDIS